MKGRIEPAGSMLSDTAGSITVFAAPEIVGSSLQKKRPNGVSLPPRREIAIGGQK